MSAICCSSLPSAAAGPGCLCSRARVCFFADERRDVRRKTVRLFGRNLQPGDYASLAGAPDEAHVAVGTLAGDLYLEMSEPATRAYYGIWLIRRADSAAVLVNDGFRISLKELRSKGLGLRIFQRQFHYARLLGIRRIETVAGRQADENGYYTWPRFGFDGPLPRRLRQELPPGLEHVQTVLDLMESHQGRLWWKEHGTNIDVTFDLIAGSRSCRIFEEYLQYKVTVHGPPQSPFAPRK
jgi:hypothetical protein